ncbi:tetratricopeptide repeat protein [Glycomyces salinus]|uniref:tetratricopeptide repeat protein n=1 Tax=Glycomyces salinus TaxID=980294 RepID=UPI0018EE0EF7|nr:tetratricopeptide repeat protein [Glycomyces salinus]
MTSESFTHSNHFEGNEIRNVIQVGNVERFEVPVPRPPDPQEVDPPPRSWVNRDAELEELERHLVAGDLGELMLEGPDGVGKTAMAQMLAARLEQRFPNGHLYVDLADGDVRTAVKSVLLRMMFPKEWLADDLKGLRGQFVSWTRGKDILVVVDDAPSREAALALKPASPRSALFVLGYQWPEHPHYLVHTVRDLEAEHAAEFLRNACPDLGAAEIDEHIGGRPWRPSALEGLVGLIRTAKRNAGRIPPGAATTEEMLEATCLGLSRSAEWHYRFLDALPGRDIEPEMLEAIGLAESTALAELEDSNLVASVGGALRVRARRTEAGRPDEDLVMSLKPVLHYYLRRVQSADRKVQGEDRLRKAEVATYTGASGFERADVALRWLDDNRSRLVELVRLAQLCGWRTEQWALAEAMWPLFSNLPYPELAERCYETALDGLDEAVPQARVLIFLGRVQVDLGEHEESESNLKRAIRLAGDDVDLVAAAKEQLGWLYYRQKRMDEAEATYLEGRELARRERTKALISKLLGFIHRDQGKDRDARLAFSDARPLFQQCGDERNIAIVEFELAALSVKLDPERHLAAADAAVKRIGEGGWTKPLVGALKRLGSILGGDEGQARIDAAKEIERGFGIES